MGAGGAGPDCNAGFYGGAPGPVAPQSVQVLFDRPERMQVSWDVTAIGQFDSVPLVVPGRQNFAQGGIYRLRLTSVPGREAVELYPTLEIAPMTNRTCAYLAHSAIPIQFTEEDFTQALSGNFVTKVIYVPDPEFQQLALAGIDTLVSTRLDPGVDPISEADRRGAILAIVRLGNKDLQIPGTEGMGAGAMGAYGMPGAMGAGPTLPTSNYISGITGPHYGMPYVGTPIGLPGPPHVPLGGPAGMQNYTLHNHTAHLIPSPTDRVNVHVKQKPGLSYPRPADNVLIQEHTIRPPMTSQQPPADMVHGDICIHCGGHGCPHCR
jgi:hypothetical protein